MWRGPEPSSAQSAALAWPWEMFTVLLLLILLLGVHVLNKTLFKRSRCRGNVPMAGKTAIITGERQGHAYRSKGSGEDGGEGYGAWGSRITTSSNLEPFLNRRSVLLHSNLNVQSADVFGDNRNV